MYWEYNLGMEIDCTVENPFKILSWTKIFMNARARSSEFKKVSQSGLPKNVIQTFF